MIKENGRLREEDLEMINGGAGPARGAIPTMMNMGGAGEAGMDQPVGPKKFCPNCQKYVQFVVSSGGRAVCPICTKDKFL